MIIQQDLTTTLAWLIVLTVLVYLLQYLVKVFFGKKLETPLQQKTDYHMIRRLQHMLTGTLFLALYPYFENKYFRVLALFIGFNIFGLHFLYRKINPKFNEEFVKNYGFLLRPHERNYLPGAFYFLFGQFLAELFYKYQIAQLSLAVLSFGDPFASLCGLYFTHSPKIFKGKTIAGTGACALVCGLIATFILYTNYASFAFIREEISISEFFIASCIIACLAELSPSNRKYYFDDNTSIPLFAGLYYTIYFYFRLN